MREAYATSGGYLESCVERHDLEDDMALDAPSTEPGNGGTRSHVMPCDRLGSGLWTNCAVAIRMCAPLRSQVVANAV